MKKKSVNRMMKKRHTFSDHIIKPAALLLALCLLFSLLPPVTAHAAENTGDGEIILINPEHADRLTEEDIRAKIAEGREELAKTDPGALETPETYQASSACKTIAEAGAVLRKGYKARTGKYVEVPVLVVDSLYDYYLDISREAFIHTGVPDEGDDFYILWEGGSVNRRKNGDGTTLMTFKENFLTTGAEEAKVNAEIKSILGKITSSSMDRRTKIRKVYDYICSNITYDYDHLGDNEYGYQYTAYAAVFNHTAVCAGYAGLFYRMMLYLGISCREITGQGNSGYHAWNIVQIGNWYFLLDSTWDAGRTEYQWYLKGSDYFPKHTAEEKFQTSQFKKDYPIYAGVLPNLGETSIRSIKNTASGIRVEWWGVSSADAYSLQRRKGSSGKWTEVAYTENKAFLDKNAETGVTYTYRVAAAKNSFTDEAGPSVPIVRLPFTDIPYNASYAKAVGYCVSHNIISGTGDNTFSPNAECTRYQFAVMLYKYAGKPAVSDSVKLPFKDVSKKKSYYKAVAWAYSEGIISGTSKTTFSPNQAITRYQAVQMLYKYAGKPKVSTSSNPFKDVKKSAGYYDAVIWAVKNGITAGTGSGKFSPMNTCRRYQMAVFLYKFHTCGND